MKIPLSWIREFTPVPADIDLLSLEAAFVNVGFEVETIDVVGNDVQGPLVVGRVLSIEEIKEHKKPIRYVGLDCGEGQTRFVICGASNFAVSDLVVVALPGAVLPGDFAISARETYGKLSDGMICSAKELRISEDHAGIIVLPADSAEPGANATQLLEIHDVVIDVAILADRGYALSIRGIARELAASLKLPYQDPVHLIDSKKFEINTNGVQVEIVDPTCASVIYLRTLSDFNSSATSPIWMKRRIEKCGMRAISLAVDVTNYVMLELGQPLHAFDRDHIAGTVKIRRAGTDSSITTLDGQQRKLHPDDVLVVDDKTALALAGTMGGENSEVRENTVSLTIEAARFDPISIAKNSRRHKLSSEASRRFERSVDPSLAQFASARAADLLIQFGGANHIGSAVSGEPRYAPIVDLDPNFVSQLLGTEVDLDLVEAKLLIIGCDIDKVSSQLWKIDPPSWRSDLQGRADFVEEVARLIGYQAIPSQLPTGKSGATLSLKQARKRALAIMMANSGYTEVLSSPFVSQEMLDILGLEGDSARSFRLANPMSESFPLLRSDLLPGLLTTLSRNLARGFKDLALFEIGSVFRAIQDPVVAEDISTSAKPTPAQLAKIYSGVPSQPVHLAAIMVGNAELSGWWGSGRRCDWSDAVSMALRIIEETGNQAQVVSQTSAPWHSGRSAEIRINGTAVAYAGELHPGVLTKLNLPERACALVVDLNLIPHHGVTKAVPVWTMPVARQDISFLVDARISAQEVEAALRSGAGELLESISLFDRYDQMADGQISLAYTLTFRAPDRTLTSEEVSEFRTQAGAKVVERFGATIRS